MPPTRTWCTFEAFDASDSVTIEWDPLRPKRLWRFVTLRADTQYQLSCHSEPARHSLKPDVDFSWRFARTFGFKSKPAADDKGRDGRPLAEVVAVACFVEQSGPRKGEAVEVYVRQTKKPSLGARSAGDLVPLELRAAPEAASAGPRSFAGLSEEAINELFQVVAEVVVERARSTGTKLLQKNLVDRVCNELKDAQGKALFKRTCEALRMVRIEDLAGAGRPLLEALLSDFVYTAVATWRTRASLPSGLDVVLQVAFDAALDSALGHQERLGGAGGRLLVGLNDAVWKGYYGDGATVSEAKKAVALAARFALAAIAECQERGSCDAAHISAMIAEPERFFDIDSSDAKALKALLARWPEAGSFIAAGLHVLTPPAGTTEIERLRAAGGMFFELALLEATYPNEAGQPLRLDGSYYDADLAAAKAESTTKDGAAKTGDSQADEATKPDVGAAARIVMMRDLFNATLDSDISRVIASSSQLLASIVDEDQRPQLRWVVQIAGSLGAYLNTYASGRKPDEEEQKRRHEARKEAINALIEAQTDRGNRLDDWVLSVGASIYTTAGLSLRTQRETGQPLAAFHEQPVALTLALAFDYHGPNRWGFHAEVAPVDLGAYVAFSTKDPNADDAGFTEPTPADAFKPTLMLGASYAFAESDFVGILGLSASYIPKWGKDDNAASRAFYLGAVAGGYLPFLDFN
ncbi:MAG: hypothetical protein R3B72_37915 [Polyangiaceae bacterium]